MQAPLADRTNTRPSFVDSAQLSLVEDASVLAPVHGEATQGAAHTLVAMGFGDGDDVRGAAGHHTTPPATHEDVERVRVVSSHDDVAEQVLLLPPPRGALIELVGRDCSHSDPRTRRVLVTHGTQLPDVY